MRATEKPLNGSMQSYYELRFQIQFLEARGSAFQDFFVAIMSQAYPGDFVPCRPWGNIGDRKNDGYLKSERTLFQLYAPNEVRQAETLRKLEEDFTEALPYWREYFDTWTFVHNSRSGLPPGVLKKLLALESEHPPIKIVSWGFDELLLRFRRLAPDSLRLLYGEPPPKDQRDSHETEHGRKAAQTLIRKGKRSEAIRVMKEALETARTQGDDAEEVELLVGLALLLPPWERRRGELQYYMRQAEEKAEKLRSIAAKVIYLRGLAAAMEQRDDFPGAEKAYRQALAYCMNEPEDEKGNLAIQACVVRSSFVHFLCNHERFPEARELLLECEEYARRDRRAEDGELFQAAMEAGVHFFLAAADEDQAILRVNELEDFATSESWQLADRIGGDLLNIANRASQRGAHRCALAAAQAAVRLGHRCYDPAVPSFLVGALYTEAMVMAQAGDKEAALPKAEALITLCTHPNDVAILQAANQLIAEIQRYSGDSQGAVDRARAALSLARGEPENVAFSKSALAVALNDNGQTEEALQEIKEALVLAEAAAVPPIGLINVLADLANYASQLGEDEDLKNAIIRMRDLPSEPSELEEKRKRALARAFANRSLRERLVNVIGQKEPAKTAGTSKYTSLRAANVHVVSPLLRLWKDWPDCSGGLYDFWGRGNFERLLLNARAFPNSFNITVEVRSLDDVKRAIRLWGLYADLLILLWKGPNENGLTLIPFPDNYEEPGGWGYTVCTGDVLKKRGSKRKWHPALAHVSIFPSNVSEFLATEARSFIATGRLVVVPAVAAGCVNPGHGPFEQLLAEAANAIPSVRCQGLEGMPIGSVPHSPDAPFQLLAELADTEASRLRKLRLLLLRRSRDLGPDRKATEEARLLALEIDDALHELEDRHARLARRKGLSRMKEPLAATAAPFRASGRMLCDVASEDSPFAPLFVLQSLGYGWRVEGPDIPRFPQRFEPQEGDVVGTWLAPPSAGWTMPSGLSLRGVKEENSK